MRHLLLLLTVALTTACTHRIHGQRVDIDIPASALTDDVHLTDCDPATDPPKCKKVRVSYKRGAATLKIVKDTPSQ